MKSGHIPIGRFIRDVVDFGIGNKIKIGINIIADDPKTVGADLIADVAGAVDIFDEGLIVDVGTIIFDKDVVNAVVIISVENGI